MYDKLVNFFKRNRNHTKGIIVDKIFPYKRFNKFLDEGLTIYDFKSEEEATDFLKFAISYFLREEYNLELDKDYIFYNFSLERDIRMQQFIFYVDINILIEPESSLIVKNLAHYMKQYKYPVIKFTIPEQLNPSVISSDLDFIRSDTIKTLDLYRERIAFALPLSMHGRHFSSNGAEKIKEQLLSQLRNKNNFTRTNNVSAILGFSAIKPTKIEKYKNLEVAGMLVKNR